MKKGNSKGLVHGVGINDVPYKIKRTESYYKEWVKKYKLTWYCPYYAKWKQMLQRCYCSKQLCYKDCVVCEEWKYLSTFKGWVDAQPERDWEVKVLDKDILSGESKIYSPSTCIFVESITNLFINGAGGSPNNLMFGVGYQKGRKKNPFTSGCSDPMGRYPYYLGSYSTEQEAHDVAAKRKYEYALELAEIENDIRVVDYLINKYKPNKEK